MDSLQKTPSSRSSQGLSKDPQKTAINSSPSSPKKDLQNSAISCLGKPQSGQALGGRNTKAQKTENHIWLRPEFYNRSGLALKFEDDYDKACELANHLSLTPDPIPHCPFPYKLNKTSQNFQNLSVLSSMPDALAKHFGIVLEKITPCKEMPINEVLVNLENLSKKYFEQSNQHEAEFQKIVTQALLDIEHFRDIYKDYITQSDSLKALYKELSKLEELQVNDQNDPDISKTYEDLKKTSEKQEVEKKRVKGNLRKSIQGIEQTQKEIIDAYLNGIKSKILGSYLQGRKTYIQMQSDLAQQLHCQAPLDYSPHELRALFQEYLNKLEVDTELTIDPVSIIKSFADFFTYPIVSKDDYPNDKETLVIIEKLEALTEYFKQLNNAELMDAYTSIYKHYLNRYFDLKHAGELDYLSGVDKDPSRLQMVLKDQFKVFWESIYNPRLIATDIPFYKADFQLALPTTLNNISCISNNEGYNIKINASTFKQKTQADLQKGNPLHLKQGTAATPIGYNIYLPQHPKGLYIRVYGGYGTLDILKQGAYNANFTKKIEAILLNNDFAVANLNLPDLLELNDHQRDMPKELYLKIQACIHEFYTTLTQNPESLHKSLVCLKNLPLFLGGGSFGASLILNHAKLYPHTFKGYIPSRGALDSAYQDFVRGYEDSPSEVNSIFPSLKTAEAIQEPALIFHNFNDANVNLQNSLNWVKAAHKKNKNVQLCILHNGSTRGPFSHRSSRYSGHADPIMQSSFETYAQQFLSFLSDPSAGETRGLSKDINKWRIHEYGIYGKKYNNYLSPYTNSWVGTIEDYFLSEAYRLYKNARPPLNLDGHSPSFRNPASLITDPQKKDAIWAEYYFPLYKASCIASVFPFRDIRGLQFIEGFYQKIPKIREALLEDILPMMSQYFNTHIQPSESDRTDLLKYLEVFLTNQITHNFEDHPNLAFPFLKTAFYLYPEFIEETVSPNILSDVEAQSPELKNRFLKLIQKSKRLGATVITKNILQLHKTKGLAHAIQRAPSSKQDI